jgi:hypothetical protein
MSTLSSTPTDAATGSPAVAGEQQAAGRRSPHAHVGSRAARRRSRLRLPDPSAFDLDDPRLVEARRRLEIVRYAESLGGGMPSRQVAVERAITGAPRSPIYGLVPAPSLSTLQRWMKRYRGAKESIAGLVDAPSTGRPSKDVKGKVARYVRKQVRANAASLRLGGVGGRPRWECLTTRVQGFADAKGLPAPTKHAVIRFVRGMPPAEVVLAALGTKRARARVARKAKHPTDAAHELIFGDEVMLPTWIRVWHEQLECWLPARAWAFFLLDAHSRAILAHWVKEPDYRTASRLLHTHLTAQEIVAITAGIIVPELAHPDDLQFVRGEPRMLRVDGSGNTRRRRSR